MAKAETSRPSFFSIIWHSISASIVSVLDLGVGKFPLTTNTIIEVFRWQNHNVDAKFRMILPLSLSGSLPRWSTEIHF